MLEVGLVLVGPRHVIQLTLTSYNPCQQRLQTRGEAHLLHWWRHVDCLVMGQRLLMVSLVRAQVPGAGG